LYDDYNKNVPSQQRCERKYKSTNSKNTINMGKMVKDAFRCSKFQAFGKDILVENTNCCETEREYHGKKSANYCETE
jgi:hypothetical protein